ncbi:hypothetical protein P9G78_03305 [Bacillus subtilis]|uniref:hypothetical protein n=1 Tax=Bacillus subtilis TaxID=1423 RepID=UPI002DB893A2|nr:hypothetical protein [Bacillus subtilis]MEC2233920.1 hypothetical protein [Bacillus subtilis]
MDLARRKCYIAVTNSSRAAIKDCAKSCRASERGEGGRDSVAARGEFGATDLPGDAKAEGCFRIVFGGENTVDEMALSWRHLFSYSSILNYGNLIDNEHDFIRTNRRKTRLYSHNRKVGSRLEPQGIQRF